MIDPTNNNTSFIPKRNPAKNERREVRRQLFVGTFIIKIIFFASLIASAGVYLYERSLQSKLDTEISSLNAAIGSFNEAEMNRVFETNQRLKQTRQRLEHTASIVTLLEAFQKSIVDSSEVSQLSLERVSDASYEVESSMKAGSFDSVMFQRKIMEDNPTLVITDIKDVTLQNVPPDNGLYDTDNDKDGAGEVSVLFKILLSADAENISHKAVPISEQLETDFTGEVSTPSSPESEVEAETEMVQPQAVEETNQEQI